MNLIYVSNSVFASKAANFLQVNNFSTALNSFFNVTTVYKKNINSKIKHQLDYKYKTIDSSGRVGHYVYSIKSFVKFLKSKKEFDVVYTRNYIFLLLFILFQVRDKKIFFEHHIYDKRKYFNLFYDYICSSEKIIHIVITQAIKYELLSNTKIKHIKIIVMHDGHNFNIQNNIQNKKKEIIKIGYFGSLNKQKGLDIIQYIVNNLSLNFEIYIYSKELDKIEKTSLVKEYRYVNQSQCEDLMSEMDILLLPVVYTGFKNDISLYTSPLKLFEYLAKGKIVIASNVSAIKEILIDSKNAILVDNNGKLWVDSINSYYNNQESEIYKIIKNNSIILSKEYTWIKRAKRIKKLCQ